MTIKEYDEKAKYGDLDALAEEAASDIAGLVEAARRADSRLASARSEEERLVRVAAGVKREFEKVDGAIREKKRQALTMIVEEKEPNARELFKELAALRQRRQELADSLSYVMSFALADAQLATRLAEAEEREAHAALIEGDAVRGRAEFLARMPDGEGAVVDFSGSVSDQMLDQAAKMRRIARDWRSKIGENRAQADRERQTVAQGGLFG